MRRGLLGQLKGQQTQTHAPPPHPHTPPTHTALSSPPTHPLLCPLPPPASYGGSSFVGNPACAATDPFKPLGDCVGNNKCSFTANNAAFGGDPVGAGCVHPGSGGGRGAAFCRCPGSFNNDQRDGCL